MTLNEFRDRFPAFVNVGDAAVQTFLDDAAEQLHQATWGDNYDRAHGLKAAMMLSDSPTLNAARVNKKTGKTSYHRQYRRLLMELGTSPIVT